MLNRRKTVQKNQPKLRAVPGQMTREEAKALLDSLKNDEHRLPAAPLACNEFKDDNKPLLKDW